MAFVWKRERNGPFGRPRYKWEDISNVSYSSSSLWRWTWQRVSKRRQNLTWRWENTQNKTYWFLSYMLQTSVAYRAGFEGGSNPPKFRSFDKAEPNSQFCGIYIHNNLITLRFHSFANWVEPLTGGGGYRPQRPVPSALCPQLNLLNPPPEKKPWLRHCLDLQSFDEPQVIVMLGRWHLPFGNEVRYLNFSTPCM
jgi:hypothetical protein